MYTTSLVYFDLILIGCIYFYGRNDYEEEVTESAITANIDGSEIYIPEKGPLSVSVPGAAMGWCLLFDRYKSGNLSFLEVRLHSLQKEFEIDKL